MVIDYDINVAFKANSVPSEFLNVAAVTYCLNNELEINFELQCCSISEGYRSWVEQGSTKGSMISDVLTVTVYRIPKIYFVIFMHHATSPKFCTLKPYQSGAMPLSGPFWVEGH